jgi:hypothetical protein
MNARGYILHTRVYQLNNTTVTQIIYKGNQLKHTREYKLNSREYKLNNIWEHK